MKVSQLLPASEVSASMAATDAYPAAPTWRVEWVGLRSYVSGVTMPVPEDLRAAIAACPAMWQVTGCDNPACDSPHCDSIDCRLWAQFKRAADRRALIERRAARRRVTHAPLSGREPDSVRSAPVDPYVEGGKHAMKVRRSNTGRTTIEVLRRGWTPVTGETAAPESVHEALRIAGLVADAMAREAEYNAARAAVQRFVTQGKATADNERYVAAVERLDAARAARYPRAHRMTLAAQGMAVAAHGARRRMVADDASARHGGDIARVSAIAVALGVLAPAQGSDTLQSSGTRGFGDRADTRGSTVLTPVARTRKVIELEAERHFDGVGPAALTVFGVRRLVAPAAESGKVWYGHRLIDRPQATARYTARADRTIATPDREQIPTAVMMMLPGERIAVDTPTGKLTITRGKSTGIRSVRFAGRTKKLKSSASAAALVAQILATADM